MTTLVLSVVGQVAGAALAGPFGAAVGQMVGSTVGRLVDRQLLAAPAHQAIRHVEGPRLNDLDVPASVEGGPIAQAFGRVKLASQVIWATRFEEVATTTSETSDGYGGGSGGKGGGGSRQTTTTTTYSYFANVAVALCEGPIAAIGRIWADGEPLDTSGLVIRLHPGDETQLPDALIQAKEGTPLVPAYRGLAYVVFERLPIGPYGNRLPQLAFEVIRPVGTLETALRAVCLIPGATEFGYHTTLVRRVIGPGASAPENRNITSASTDVVASLDELQALAPNLSAVAIVLPWYASDLRCGVGGLKPGVDTALKETIGAQWSVAGVGRAGTHAVSLIAGRPAYGGTPSDESVVAIITELKRRGLRVTLMPFILVDVPPDNDRIDPWTGAAPQPAHPWRGRITVDPAPGRAGTPDGLPAAAAQIGAFFGSAQRSDFALSGQAVVYGGPSDWGLRRMVLHYAMLSVAAGGVDTMMLGSELVGLTRVRSGRRNFPAADALATLAADVKAIVGPATTVTYGADWTEYGAYVPPDRPGDLLFPLDPVWASPAIDRVGIDLYWPLADWRDGVSHADAGLGESAADAGYLALNVAGGEGFHWYYPDETARIAQDRRPIEDGAYRKSWVHRPKDLIGWWSHPHVERLDGIEVGSPTGWVPGMKPIRFTELGCPAVDKGTNRPSCFPDAKSSAAALPPFSSGARDDLVQRRAIEAVIRHFDPGLPGAELRNPPSPLDGRPMVELGRAHVWCWDARPWPAFPVAAEVWSDGGAWRTGHWLNGRLGAAPLESLIPAIAAAYAGPPTFARGIDAVATGLLVDRPMAGRSVLEPVADAFALDVVDRAGRLEFKRIGAGAVTALDPQALAVERDRDRPVLTRAQESELPRAITLVVADPESDFRRAAVSARRQACRSMRQSTSELALAVSPEIAEIAAERRLALIWTGRETVSFAVPPSRLALEPGDVVSLPIDGSARLFRIERAEDGLCRRIEARAVDPGTPVPNTRSVLTGRYVLPRVAGPAEVAILDLPSVPGFSQGERPLIAAAARPWPGGYVVRRSQGAVIARLDRCATMGATTGALPAGPVWRFDRNATISVALVAGTLGAVGEAHVLDGANVAALRHPGGWEVIQFALAELVGPSIYRLSGLLRGQAGTEARAQAALAPGATFVLLDRAVEPLAIGLGDIGRPISLIIAPTVADDDPAGRVTLDLTPRAEGLKPLSPVSAHARRTAAGVEIGFIRRTRVAGDSWELAEVPLGEEGEAYEVDVMDGSIVRRTLRTREPVVVYPAADELADFGVARPSLRIAIHQMSATLGRGAPLVVTLTP